MSPHLLRSPARLASASLLRVQSDERLVELARDGHERAFEAIFERYRPALERYATRLVGPSRGEDAVQQAFVNAHRALISESDRKIELRPWLYRIVHNAALNALRSSRDEQLLGDEAERLPLADDVIERRERLREALDAVAALPEKQRDAILLRELEGRSHDEIAVALGMSTGAARQQIFRARAALRAAATAITPAPLIIRVLEMSAGSASGTPDIAMGAGAGLTAVLAKAGAGVLVTGAVVGGAVGTGVVPDPVAHHHHHRVTNVQASPSATTAKHEAAELTALEIDRGGDATHHATPSPAASVGSAHHHRGGSLHGGSSTGGTGHHLTVVVKRGTTTHHASAAPMVIHHTETHHSGGTHETSHHGGSHHGGVDDNHGAEPTELETGDAGGKPAGAGGKPVGVSGKPVAVQGGGGGGKGGAEATAPTQPAPAPGPATTTPTAAPTPVPQQGGGGGGGGGSASGGGNGTVTQQAAPGGGGKG